MILNGRKKHGLKMGESKKFLEIKVIKNTSSPLIGTHTTAYVRHETKRINISSVRSQITRETAARKKSQNFS